MLTRLKRRYELLLPTRVLSVAYAGVLWHEESIIGGAQVKRNSSDPGAGLA